MVLKSAADSDLIATYLFVGLYEPIYSSSLCVAVPEAGATARLRCQELDMCNCHAVRWLCLQLMCLLEGLHSKSSRSTSNMSSSSSNNTGSSSASTSSGVVLSFAELGAWLQQQVSTAPTPAAYVFLCSILEASTKHLRRDSTGSCMSYVSSSSSQLGPESYRAYQQEHATPCCCSSSNRCCWRDLPDWGSRG